MPGPVKLRSRTARATAAGDTSRASDAEVIAGSLDDPERFAVIFDRHADEIYGYAARRLGQQAAADAASEVFLAAFRNRGRYQPSRPDARPWLYGIATKVVGQQLRAEGRQAHLLAAVPAAPPAEFPAASAVRSPCAEGPRVIWASKSAIRGYLTKLPGTVSGMRSYLLDSDGPNGPAAYRVLDSIVNNSSASGELVPNASYALMYRAALTVKGVYRVRRATTIAGTAGIAVAACIPAAINKGSMPGFRGCPYRTELIPNARTYQLIGVDYTPAPGKPRLPGRPNSALLNIAVVNKIGQIP